MKDLTKGSEPKQIFFFALPMLIGNVFQQLYNTVDSIIVGNALGKNALAAVGASFPIIFLLISLIIGITMGATILISQYYGAKQMVNVKKTIDTVYVFLFFASLFTSVLGVLVSGHVLKLLDVPQQILPQAKLYLNIIFAGIIFMFGFNSISAILRGLGDSKTPLYFLIIATLVNIVLDLLFILVMGWGVAGAALATVIAQGISFVISVYYLNKTHDIFRFGIKTMKFDKHIFNQSMKIGMPSGIQQMLVASGLMALSRIVNGFGTNVMAAYAAAGRIDAFAFMPAMNIAVALSAFVGQNLGANKEQRVVKGFKAALIMASIISLLTTIGVIFFGEGLVWLFNKDPNVIETGTRYLTIVGSFYIVFSTMFVVNGVLRGAGDTLVPMFITALTLWAIRIPLSAFLSQKMGPDGIWWGTPAAWIIGLSLSTGYYLSGRWKSKVVTKRIGDPQGNL